MENKVALADTPETAVEVAGHLDLNQSAFDAIVKFAEQTEKIGKALDTVRTFFFKRAYSGDFVTHNCKTINVSGPGAERILSSLGLMGVSWSLTDWEKHKDEGNDKLGDWYTHWYSAEAKIGNMAPGRLEGRAGSRDKLFGYKSGSWKDLSEVKEPDIQMAARRCVYKELVRIGLGLRNIPIEEAVAMGLDKNKIAKIEFGQAGETKVTAAPAGTSVNVKEVTRFKGTNKTTGKDYVRYDVIDTNGAKYSTFDEALASAAEGFKKSGKPAVIGYAVGKFGNDITEIGSAPEPAEAVA